MKKLLLISYYFPPCGGAGVQRWLRIIKWLDKLGWDISVITTNNGDYPVIDDSLIDKVPNSVKIYRTKTPVFGNFYKKVSGDKKNIPFGSLETSSNDSLLKIILFWIRINLIIPDARLIWNKYAYKQAKELLTNDKFDIVLTTAPPHSTHLVGNKLKRNFNITWVTDFRDPWSEIMYLQLAGQSKISRSINKYLEKKVVKNADLNLVVSDFIKDQLPAGFKETFTNSFDPDDFQNKSYQRSELFRIKYIGKITAGQDIDHAIKAISSSNINHHKLEFSFVGTYQSCPILDTPFSIRNIAFVQHNEAINEMVNSELLVLLINDYEGNEGMLTTKLFEYIGSQVPILCIGPKNGNAAKIISSSDSGFVADYNDIESSKLYIQSIYQSWEKNQKDFVNNSELFSIKEMIIDLDNMFININKK